MNLNKARKTLNLKANASIAEQQERAQLHIDNSGAFPIRFKHAAVVILRHVAEQTGQIEL